MLDVKKNALHSHPSLLPLRMALLAAESESPARPPRMDVNEQRALQLIEKVKAEYKKRPFVMNWNDIPSPYGFYVKHQEMVNSNA